MKKEAAFFSCAAVVRSGILLGFFSTRGLDAMKCFFKLTAAAGASVLDFTPADKTVTISAIGHREHSSQNVSPLEISSCRDRIESKMWQLLYTP